MISFPVPATETALIALDVVKAELGIAGTDADARLERMIAAVSQTIARLCSRANFGAATAAETLYRLRLSGPIWLRHWPVMDIVSVTLDGTIIDPAEYELEEGRALHRICGDMRIPWCAGKLVIVYEGGYGLPDGAPDDLAGAALTLVRSAWTSSRRDPMAKVEEVPDVMRTEYWVGGAGETVGGVPDEVMTILQNYTNFGFG